jgi:hypothetical protein
MPKARCRHHHATGGQFGVKGEIYFVLKGSGITENIILVVKLHRMVGRAIRLGKSEFVGDASHYDSFMVLRKR